MSLWETLFAGRRRGKKTGESGPPDRAADGVTDTRVNNREHAYGAENDIAAIGGAKVLLYLNVATVRSLEAKGIDWQGAVCYFLAENGSGGELDIKSAGVSLSEASKARCIATPIYRERGGGLCALFDTLDASVCAKERLTYLGTVDPERYAAALCAKLRILDKDIYV